MRALVCHSLGNPLALSDPPYDVTNIEPSPVGEVSVRIKVFAAGLNFADALLVQGRYQEQPKLPFSPGAEISGEVIQVGSKVQGVRVGDKVCAVSGRGAFAEECVVNADAVFKLPAGVDTETAAGLPVTFGTSHIALKLRAKLKKGQTVLVLGAAGGVGLAAVQISKVLGATVIAVARGAEKMPVLRRHGADVCIDLADPSVSLRDAVKAACPTGVEVVYDPVGGKLFFEALKVVKWGAQILVIGFASGDIPKIPANIALVKNLTIHGIFWGSYMVHQVDVLRESLEELLQWWAHDRIQVQVSHRFPLEQAREAFEVLLSRKVVGKVLLIPPKQGSFATAAAHFLPARL